MGPEGTSKLYKQVAETPLVSILVAWPPLPQSIPMTSLQPVDRGIKKIESDLWMGVQMCRMHIDTE